MHGVGFKLMENVKFTAVDEHNKWRIRPKKELQIWRKDSIPLREDFITSVKWRQDSDSRNCFDSG